MEINDIINVCVIGAGNMGNQISLLCAMNGFKTTCMDIDENQLEKARQFGVQYLPGRVQKEKLTQEQADRAAANIRYSSNLEEAASDADIVIEAAIENLEVKRALFARLDRICPAHTILATNSSFIPSSQLVDVTKRPSKVCNMHFFNPALVMKCVEVVKGPHTSEETAKIVLELCARLNKIPSLLKKEIYGLLVNRILAAINNEALYLLDMGIASIEDIDSAVVNALGHPMGPFRLMDLTGIDLSYHISMEKYRETGDPVYKPSPSIIEKYVKGEMGEKTGKGFYNYDVK